MSFAPCLTQTTDKKYGSQPNVLRAKQIQRGNSL